MEEVCQVVGKHLRQVGFTDYRKSNFIELANRWSIGCQKALCKGNTLSSLHTYDFGFRSKNLQISATCSGMDLESRL